MTHKFSGMFLLGLLLLSPQLAACAGGGSQVLPVKEADFGVRDQQPFWLDNTHVLFRGYTGSEGVLGKDFRYLNEAWYVWDIEGGTVSKDTQFEGAGPECINGHTKSYVLRYPTDNETPKRQAFVNGQKNTLPDRTWLNPISCRLSSTEPSWVVKGRATRPLLEEHGYLDRGEFGEDRHSKDPILYYRVGITEPISLGLEASRVEPLVTYYPFASAYLLEGVPTDGYAPPPLWLLHPEGRLDQIFSPKGKAWAESPVAGRKERFSWGPFHLTKRAFFIVETSVPKVDGSEKAGGYLLDGDTPRRVVQGSLRWGTVSPDGCKIAFITRRWRGNGPEEKRAKLQVIDVCHGGDYVN